MCNKTPTPNKPEVRDLFVHLGEQLIRQIEQQPITVTYVFADATRTYELKPEDPLHKRLSRGRSEALRASLAKLRGTGGKT